MPAYRVAFDGKWQGDFDDKEEALDWARAVSETGRIVHVAAFASPVVRWIIGPKLVAAFPDNRGEEARTMWKTRGRGAGGGGISGVPF